jgi:hypothetical protein
LSTLACRIQSQSQRSLRKSKECFGEDLILGNGSKINAELLRKGMPDFAFVNNAEKEL